MWLVRALPHQEEDAMENKIDPRGYRSPSELLRDAYVPRSPGDTTRPPYTHTARFEALAEKIAQGDIALANTLLRHWGVR